MRVRRVNVEPVDLVVAGALTLALQAEVWLAGALGAETVHDERIFLSLTSLAISLPLAVRRSWPWGVAILALGAEVLQQLVTTPPEGLGNLLAMLLVCYSLGRYARRPRGYAGILLIAAVSFAVGQDLADNTFVLLVLGAAWGAGLLVAHRMDDLGVLELRRLSASRAGAVEERERIARELHDVVAHRVSMMVVQSQLADAVLEHDPAQAHAAIGAVTTAGREALAELRSLLGLMHHDDGAGTSPSETDLGRLSEVVAEAHAGGLPVTFETTGVARPVPPAVALAAFRIVQESLTNVVRHAASAPTHVQLDYRTEGIAVSIEDDGEAAAELRPGHGLSGMQERAAFLGGSLSVTRGAAGGVRVAAVLPTPGGVR